MSELKVEITTVQEVLDAPNSTFLSYVRVYDNFWCIHGKDKASGKHQVSPGDKIIHVPTDAVLKEKLITYFFGEGEMHCDSPIKHRVRAERIRKNMSNGFILRLDDPELLALWPALAKAKLGDDVRSILEIEKYEPPVSSLYKGMQAKAARKHPDFREYTDVSNYKYYGRCFQDGEEVSITLKLHGTAQRCSLLTTRVVGIKELVQKIFNMLPSHTFLYGSRRVQLSGKAYVGYYAKPSLKKRWEDFKYAIKSRKLSIIFKPKREEKEQQLGDVYKRTVDQFNLKSKVEPGVILYGETFGKNIQSNYDYGVPEGKVGYACYDVMRDGVYLDRDDFVAYCTKHEIPTVPELYRGPFSEAIIEKIRNANDHELDKKVPTREGIVIKPVKERSVPSCGRLVLKALSDKYLLDKSNSDNH